MSIDKIGATMDQIAWLILCLHELIGHDKTADALGVPRTFGEGAGCSACQYERTRSPADRETLLHALKG
jgi:hypothetical protein